MDKKTFLLAFDALDRDSDYDKIKDFIKNGNVFSSWWNYIPFVFLVTTDLTPRDLSASLKREIGDAGFLVIEVDPAQSDGFLPRRAWEWIKRREKEREPTHETNLSKQSRQR